MIVVALTGKIGVGKDYICKNFLLPKLTDHYPTQVIAFADSLKDRLATSFTYDELYKNKTEMSRKALISVAAELRSTDPEIFIKALQQKIQLAEERGFKAVIITDLRLMNEYVYLRSINATIIRIYAPNRSKSKVEYKEVQSDVTETNLDKIDWGPDNIINNDDLDLIQLNDRIDYLLKLHLKLNPKETFDEDEHKIISGIKSAKRFMETEFQSSDEFDIMDHFNDVIVLIHDKLNMMYMDHVKDVTYQYKFNAYTVNISWAFINDVICIIHLPQLPEHILAALTKIALIDENNHITCRTYIGLKNVIKVMNGCM